MSLIKSIIKANLWLSPCLHRADPRATSPVGLSRWPFLGMVDPAETKSLEYILTSMGVTAFDESAVSALRYVAEGGAWVLNASECCVNIASLRAAEKRLVVEAADRIARHNGASLNSEAIRMAAEMRMLFQPPLREVSSHYTSKPCASVHNNSRVGTLCSTWLTLLGNTTRGPSRGRQEEA
jgi:hypothetical protein